MTHFHKYKKVHGQCTNCKAPDGTRVWRSKTRPGIWTDEQDLTHAYPEEWNKIGAIVIVSPLGLCQNCRARRAEWRS